ncbi:MAG: hypothetical protein ACRC2H_00960 [Silanimonas sp.]
MSTKTSDPDNIDEETLDYGNDIDGTPDPEALAELAAGGEQEGEGEDEGDGADGADAGAADGEGGEGGTAAPAQGARNTTVPYGRFKEVNESLRTERDQRIRLEERLRALEDRAAAPAAAAPAKTEAPAFDVKDAIKRRNAAILEGDDEKAAEIELQIEENRLAEAERRAEAKVEQRLQAREQKDAVTLLQQKAVEVIQTYPFLNSKSADADPDLIADVTDLRDVYIKRGKTPAEALSAAIEKLKPALDAKAGKPAGAPAKTAADIAEERRVASIQRNAKAAGAQPPRNPGVGSAAAPDTVNVMEMSADDWEELPESERAKLLA